MGKADYKLDLPPHIRTHDVFHFYLFKKHVVDKSHIIDWNNVQVESEGDFHAEQMCILDKREVVLRKQTIVHVKVQCPKHYTPEEAPWEIEYVMRQVYPFLFQDYDKTE